MSRNRGGGRGCLLRRNSNEGEKWVAQWHIYTSSGKRMKRERTLGFVRNMDEQDARAAVSDLQRRASSQDGRVRGIGYYSELRFADRQRLQKVGSLLPGKIGAIAELSVCLDLLSKGYDVFRAIDPMSSCDLVAILGEEKIRVEVKQADPNTKSNRLRVDVRRNAGKFDVLAVVSSDGTIRYGAHDSLCDAVWPSLQTFEKSGCFDRPVSVEEKAKAI